MENIMKKGDGNVLTVPEAAEFLRIGRAAAYKGVECGEIPSIKVGRRILVPKQALYNLMETGNQAPKSKR